MIDLEQFVGKTVVITREDGKTREGVIERRYTSTWPYGLWLPDDDDIPSLTYTRDGYWWESKDPSSFNIKSIKLKEEDSMIDLEQFINKTVVVTREDGTIKEGVIERNVTPTLLPYKLRYSSCAFITYTKDGYYWPHKCPNVLNIKSIKLKEESLEQRLETIQREAELIKQQLKRSFPTLQDAKPGDLLEDGTVVIEKYNGAALIAAPKVTEVVCKWTPEFQPVFDKLKEHNLNPSQWFIPTQKQLKLAYKNKDQHFSSTDYWSSTEGSSTVGSSTCAYLVKFNNGFHYTASKTNTFFVRAFRFVSF